MRQTSQGKDTLHQDSFHFTDIYILLSNIMDISEPSEGHVIGLVTD